MAIKAADISNPARNLNLSKTWSENIMEEFFKQGDNERALKLPISNLCDRHTTVIPKAQSGFFEYVALPTFKAWSKFVGSPLSVRLCENIIRNKSYWDKQIWTITKLSTMHNYFLVYILNFCIKSLYDLSHVNFYAHYYNVKNYMEKRSYCFWILR